MPNCMFCNRPNLLLSNTKSGLALCNDCLDLQADRPPETASVDERIELNVSAEYAEEFQRNAVKVELTKGETFAEFSIKPGRVEAFVQMLYEAERTALEADRVNKRL